METHSLPLIYVYAGSSQHTKSHKVPTEGIRTMPNLRIRSKEAICRAKLKGDVNCKKHPKHKQSPGVCSLCLSERLSRLSTPNSSRSTSTAAGFSSSSSSSTYSYSCSSTCSSCASPLHRYMHADQAKGSLLLGGKNVVLTNCRSSLGSIPWKRTNNDRNKREGFWSKLLRPREGSYAF